MSPIMTIEEIALCVLIGFLVYRFTKSVFCFIRNTVKARKKKTLELSGGTYTPWQHGFYFAEKEIRSHPYGYVTIEDILHEVAMDNCAHEEYYVGMSAYLELYYKRRDGIA